MIGEKVLIKNGIIVSPNGEYRGNVFIENGKISAILDENMEVPADKVIDASNRYVMPGAVDEHTHMDDPGYTDREEFVTGTSAAAWGGVTTVIDHHRNIPAVYARKELDEKIEYLRDKSVVDFGLMGGICPTNLEDVEAMWEGGITSFKTFTCNLHGVLAMHPGTLLKFFRKVKSFHGNILIHCEDGGVCDVEEERLKGEGRKDFASQMEWRSGLSERIATETVIELVKETGCTVTVAHVSQAELLKKIHAAREEGYPIYAETCPHYFYLTDKMVAANGPWMKFTPPPKSAENAKEMWKLFNLGYISTIGSDHCPWPMAEKVPGLDDIWKAPNGIPGVETSLRLMLNAVNEGKTNLPMVVRTMCEGPAIRNGIYPLKGVIQPGADADVIIVDMNRETLIDNANVISKCRWSPYHGWMLKGAPETIMVRGRIVVDHYDVVGKAGDGHFVARIK